MTITSSGALCDVCGNLILPIDPEELVHEFSVKGISQNLHCDTKCKELLLRVGKNWEQLPHEGALYKAFEDAQGRTMIQCCGEDMLTSNGWHHCRQCGIRLLTHENERMPEVTKNKGMHE